MSIIKILDGSIDGGWAAHWKLERLHVELECLMPEEPV
jgi:hypothetical protein